MCPGMFSSTFEKPMRDSKSRKATTLPLLYRYYYYSNVVVLNSQAL